MTSSVNKRGSKLLANFRESLKARNRMHKKREISLINKEGHCFDSGGSGSLQNSFNKKRRAVVNTKKIMLETLDI